jgi:hypothetical protein
VDGLLVFVPVLGAPLLHAPVLRWNLFRSLAIPLDGGISVRGRRLFGANKTLRGAIVMWCGVTAATLALSLWGGWWSELPADARSAGPFVLGALLGLGTVVGELPNSFLKRQLGIAPGERGGSAAGLALSLWDQADFVPVIALVLLPLWAMPLPTLAAAFAIVTVVHLGLNVAGYALGAREAPI